MRFIIYTLATVAALAGCANTPTPAANAGQSQAQLMFVQSAEDILKVDAATSGVAAGEGESSRPCTSPTGRSGSPGISSWPTTCRDVEGRQGQTSAPIRRTRPSRSTSRGARSRRSWWSQLTKPVVDGADLVYTYKIVEGTMPANGGATSLFIDWYGVALGRASTVSASGDAASRGCPDFCV